MNYEQNGHQFHFGWTVNRMVISSILDELWTEWPSVPFWINYEQNGHQFRFGRTVNRMAISFILDELWTEWPSVSFWMNYEQNGHQFHFGWTVNRMTISSILDELWTERSSNFFCDCTRSILNELWTEQPSVPLWMNYGQNNHQLHFGWTIDRMVIKLPWLHQFHFGWWTIDSMTISSFLDELWTEWSSVPFWMTYGQNDHQFHFGSTGAVMGARSLWSHIFIFISNSWCFNPAGLKIESGFTYHTTRASSFNTCLLNN